LARSEPAISVLLLDEHTASHLRFIARDDGLSFEGQSTGACGGPGELRDFAAETNLPDRAFVTVIPRHEATLRILTLPSRNPAEIASMVSLASEELAPFPREQLVIRHHILGALPSGESRVLVVLLHEDVVNKHIDRLRAAGLEPAGITFSTACLYTAVTASPHTLSGHVAFSWVSDTALEVLVIRDGILEFSRGVDHHGPWAIDNEADRDALGLEIRDALAAYRRESEDGEGVDTLYISGDAIDEDVRAALEPTAGVPCCPAPFPPQVPILALGAAMAAQGGAAMNFDFLPSAILRQRALRDFQSTVRRVGVMVAVLLLLLLAAFGQSVYQRMALINELGLRAQAIASVDQGTPMLQRGLDAIARQVDQGGNFLALLAAVAQAAPAEGLNITRVEYDRESGMNIWGRARSKDLVLGNFLGQLRQLGEGSLAQLARAHSAYETPGQERGQAIVNYHIAIPALMEEPSHDAPAPLR
jgi:hypothetical protein